MLVFRGKNPPPSHGEVKVAQPRFHIGNFSEYKHFAMSSLTTLGSQKHQSNEGAVGVGSCYRRRDLIRDSSASINVDINLGLRIGN